MTARRTAAMALALLASPLVGCGSSSHSTTMTGAGTGPPSGSMPLASVDSAASGHTVDGIRCQTQEQVLFHIHAHLAVFVDGRPRSIPYGIGIAAPRQIAQTPDGPFVAGGSCFYWLHSHTADGIIHIESPLPRVYTLGNYFDEWRQPLGTTKVGPTSGSVAAYVNGQPYAGDPRNIALRAHTLIQLDVGQRVPPVPFNFPSGL